MVEFFLCGTSCDILSQCWSRKLDNTILEIKYISIIQDIDVR